MIGNMQVSSFQMMEVGRIMKDLATGQTALLERSTLTLAASTGILGNALGALLSPIGLVAVAIVGIVAAIISHARATDELNKSLAATGNYAASSASEISQMAEQVGISSQHFGLAS